LLSIAGHKLYGPKGIGALYVRDGIHLEPLVHGAGHESGRRAGTENILLDVGLGAACALAESWIGMESVRQLRDQFWSLLQEQFGAEVVLNGHPAERLPNTLNVSFVGKVGSEILAWMEGVAASTGSACHSGSVQLSPVLNAMKIDPQVGMGAIRFSLGRTTSREEIETWCRCSPMLSRCRCKNSQSSSQKSAQKALTGSDAPRPKRNRNQIWETEPNTLHSVVQA
jgi:cysteine desulfurase